MADKSDKSKQEDKEISGDQGTDKNEAAAPEMNDGNENNTSADREQPEQTLNETSEEEHDEASDEEQEDFLADDDMKFGNAVYKLQWNWSAFELSIISPTIDPVTPPVLIEPEKLSNSGEVEFVYPIYDHGYKLSTSKASDMFNAGMSMCKLYYTIEKMIFLLVERLKSGGIGTDTEVQVSFSGFDLAQRKAFESIINLAYNVVVTNFDPGKWGEDYLDTVKRIADKGFGYPSEAPRDVYKHVHPPAPSAKR